MKGLLFLNGTPPLKTEIEKAVAENKDSKIYCTDGAYTYLSNVCLPNTVVGDFDSVAREEINCKCEIITFNADKDFTDGFLSDYAAKQRSICLFKQHKKPVWRQNKRNSENKFDL